MARGFALRRRFVVVPFAVVTMAAAASRASGPFGDVPQQPTAAFRTGVDLVTIDVQVTPARDAPIRAFSAADFDISIAGRKRPAASATHLHDDEGRVTRNPMALPDRDTPPTCVFGFQRKADRRTAHYLIGVERTEADRKEVKQVRVNMTDKAFAVQTYRWRSPISAVATSAGPSSGAGSTGSIPNEM